MIAFVEQPDAIAALTAFSTDALVINWSSVILPKTSSTARLPQAADIRLWFESAAGIDELPEKQTPKASAIAVMVLAVPMVIHTP